MNREREIAGAYEFVDDAWTAAKKLLEILRGVGALGDAIQGGAQALGALAL